MISEFEITHFVSTLLRFKCFKPFERFKLFRGNGNEGETVAQVSADYHPDGVISGLGKLEKGLYSLVVTAEGVPPLNYYYQLRVEMVDYAKIARAWIGPVLISLFLSWLLYKLIQSGRLRALFSPRQD